MRFKNGLVRLWLVVLLAGAGAEAGMAADFSSWQHRMKFTFAGYDRSEALSQFPVLVTFSNRVGFDYGQFLSGPWADLRFTDGSMTQELPFEVESWNTGGASVVWLQLPQLSGTNTAVWAFWGKADQTAQPYTTNGAVWNNGYAAVWHLDDSADNSKAADSSPNRRNMANTLSTNAVGVTGAAQGFDPTMWMTATGGLGNLSVTGVTLSAWVQLRGNYNYPMMLTYAGTGGMDFRFSTTSRQLQQLFVGGNVTAAATDAIPENQWRHVAITLDDAANLLLLFVNGRSVTNMVSAALHAPTGGVAYIARRDSQYGFNGLLDEMQVSSVPRSTNWIWASWMNMASNTAFSEAWLGQPVISNVAPDAVDNDSATARCYLSSTGDTPTTVTLYWGTTDGGSATGAWETAVAIDPVAEGPLSANLTGLTPNQTYWYTFYASNSGAAVWAQPAVSFKTWGPPAVDNGGGADRIGFTVARLRGSLLNGFGAQAFIYWGESAGSLTNVISLGPVNEGPFASSLPGLSPASTYYYRSFASNDYGTAWAAATESFTTTATGNYYCATNGPAWGDGSSWGMAFTNIQSALDAAQDNDLIRLAGQTFTVATSLTWTSRSGIRLEGGWEGTGLPGSNNPALWSTVIQRNPSNSVRVMRVQNVTNSVLKGVTLQNGYVAASPYYGAGLYVSGSTFTLDDCVIVSNMVYAASESQNLRGAGLCSQSSVMTVTNCTIVFNRMVENSRWSVLYGGGISILAGTGMIDRCIVSGNSISSPYYDLRYGNAMSGGGVYSDGKLAVRHGRISANSLYSKTDKYVLRGAGVYAATNASLFNTIVALNDATREVGVADADGVFLAAAPQSEVLNCTVAGNNGEGLRTSGAIAVSNSIFWANQVDLAGFPTNAAGVLTNVFYCDTADGVNPEAQGCISADPLFERGFYLAAGSLCANAGGGSAASWGLDGRTVRADGAADADTVDLGFHAEAGVNPVVAELYVSESGVDSNSGTSEGEAFRSVTRALAAAGEGSHIHIGAGTFTNETFPLTVNPQGVWLTGANAGETILKAAANGKGVVSMTGVFGARLENLTLTGGAISGTYGGYGAGLYALNSAFDMAGCIVSNNSITITGNELGIGPNGNGLYAGACVVRMTNCLITGNSGGPSTRLRANYFRGGGASFFGGDIRVVDTMIVSNRLTGRGYSGNSDRVYGAGLFASLCNLTLERCVISRNTGTSPELGYIFGAGLYADGIIRLLNVLVESNEAYSATAIAYGDGAYFGPGSLDMRQATIAGNGGQGIYNGGVTAVTVANSILWGNGDDVVAFPTNAAGVLTGFRYCDIEDGDNNGIDGTISSDPLFADTTWYHLSSRGGTYTGGYFSGGIWEKATVQSPLIDAGDPASPWQAEPFPNGRRVNMGAYGNTAAASYSMVSGTMILIR